jgi:hypothetical protein
MLPLNVHKNEYVFGRGKTYVDIFDANGNKTGERFLGNCPGFTLSVTSEKFEHFSSTSGLRKKDLSVVTSVNFSGKITCDDVSSENLALFVGGTVSTVTQSATPVTGEAHTVRAGLEYQLGATAANPMGVKDVSAVTLKSADGVTSYVLGTDYVVDLAKARFSPLKGGAITDGTIVHAGYTPKAGTIQRVTSGAGGSQTGAVRYIADNAVGENRDCYISSAALAASGDLPLITENDLAKFDLDVGVNEKDSATPQIIIDGQLVTA